MSIRIVQLGTARARGEGPRLGTVRRPPRGVPKIDWAHGNWFDVWLPNLAPSAALMKQTRIVADKAAWRRFERGYRTEMSRPEASHLLDALATLSHVASFAVGCYCDDEDHCHRSILRQLLATRGADVR